MNRPTRATTATTATTATDYLGACNPSRRAKRSRIDDVLLPLTPPLSSTTSSPTASFPAAPPSVAPRPASPSSGTTAKRRVGRKPGTLPRAAREAQRKMNHSLIEKARRTKINDALAALRALVPRDDEDHPAEPGKAAAASASSNEREFKLEILERTVAYLQELATRVKALECTADRSLCPSCATATTAETHQKKRKQPDGTGTGSGGGNVGDDGYDADNDNDGTSGSTPTQQQQQQQHLPPISAWLPLCDQHHALDPSSLPLPLPLTPNPSPNPSPDVCPARTSPASIAALTHQQKGPAPSPLVFHRTPPALMLPSPSLEPLAAAASSPRRAAPPSPEERSAATLLLQIASSSSLTSSPSYFPTAVKPHTPSSILGLVRDD
jgi:hypothetical protein